MFIYSSENPNNIDYLDNDDDSLYGGDVSDDDMPYFDEFFDTF